MIAIPLATYRADPRGAMDLAERDPDGRVVVTNDDGSPYMTIAIPKDARPDEADLSEQLAEARREIARLRAAPGSRLVEAARDTARSLARWAQAVRESAPKLTVQLDPSWAENRAKRLESAIAALPEWDVGKAITAPELNRIASTLTEADDLPDIGRAKPTPSGPDAGKDMRAVLVEARASLEACDGLYELGRRAGTAHGIEDVNAAIECAGVIEARARAAARAIGEALEVAWPNGPVLCPCPEVEALRKAAHHESWKLGSQIEERDHQLAREREAVDGLIQAIDVDHLDDQATVRVAIEAVRKSREGAGSSPPDERLGWAAEIRARASPCLELRGLELHDSGEQTVGPRVVALPDAEGWWARKETRRVEWLYVEPIAETGDEGAPTVLSTWVSAFRRHFPIAEMSGPGIEWVGPIALPEGWS